MGAAKIDVRNRLLVSLLLVLPLLVIAIVLLAIANQLPEITATHWSATYPDGFTATRVFVLSCFAIAALGALLGLLALGLGRKPAALLVLLGLGGVLSWVTAGVFVGSALPTALAETPQQAVLGPWVIFEMACSIFGLAPLWICGVYPEYAKQQQLRREARIHQGRGPELEVPRTATIPVGPAQHFSSSTKGPWWMWLLSFFVLAMGLFVAGLGLVSPEAGENLVGLLFGVLFIVVLFPITLALAWVRVTIDGERFRVTSALLRFPLRTIKIVDIATAASEVIEPLQWGGWGWRLFPGGSAVVLKKSEGITVETVNGKRFAVTIANAQVGAAQLNAQLQRIRG